MSESDHIPQTGADPFEREDRRIYANLTANIVHSVWRPNKYIVGREVGLDECYGDLWLSSAELQYQRSSSV